MMRSMTASSSVTWISSPWTTATSIAAMSSHGTLLLAWTSLGSGGCPGELGGVFPSSQTRGPPISVFIWGRHGVADSNYGHGMGGCTEPWVRG